MNPKYKIADQVDCPSIVGWVVAIYMLHEGQGQPVFVYGIEEPEDGHTYYFTEEELA